LYQKDVKQQADEGRNDLGMVEMLADDANDAKLDFFAAHIWDFPEGPGKPGSLSVAAYGLDMFRLVPDLDDIGRPLAPDRDYNYWRYFADLFRINDGGIKLVPGGLWVEQSAEAPHDKNYWHLQYQEPASQQYNNCKKWRCRGSPNNRGQWKTEWRDVPKLDWWQVWQLWESNICKLDPSFPRTKHYARVGTMMTLPRFIIFLLKNGGQWTMEDTMKFYLNQETIAWPRTRGGH
jgi:hypothetical protein